MSVYRRGKVFFTVNGVRVFRSTGMTTKRETRKVENAERHRSVKEFRQSPSEKRAKTLLVNAIEQAYEAKWKHGKDSQRSYRRACNLADPVGILSTTLRHASRLKWIQGNPAESMIQ